MKANLPAAPWQFTWTPDNISHFWGMVGESPLDELSFSRAAGPQVADLMAELLPAHARIIDFGAGSGHLSRCLLERGFKVAAYEPSEERRQGIPPDVRQHPNFLGFETKGVFDATACFEVMEHIHPAAEAAVFNALAALMDENSLLIGSTPYEERLQQSLCICPNCAAMFHRWQHMRSFSIESLGAYLGAHGLSLKKILTPDWSACSMIFIAEKKPA